MGDNKKTVDIEASSLLEDAIDYTKSPYQLKEDFVLHCIVVHDHNNNSLIAFYDGDKYVFDGRRYEEKGIFGNYVLEDYHPVPYQHRQLNEFVAYVDSGAFFTIVGHNIINYDLLVLKLWFGLDYEIGPDIWNGKEVYFEDTFVTSKCLNPDRFCGHSLEKLSKLTGLDEKIDFRKNIPIDLRFKEFAADMLYYCIYDARANTGVYQYLEWEKGDWDWKDAIELEKAVAEIVTRQQHRGFKFDKVLAEKCVSELDQLMEERRLRVEPLLPPRPATKKFMNDHTPPASQILTKDIYPPKVQFKKSTGEPSANLYKFAEKYGYVLNEDGQNKWYMVKDQDEITLPLPLDVAFVTEKKIAAHFQNFLDKHNGKVNESLTKVKVFDKIYNLPLKIEPLKTEMVATIDDTTHIKNWLVGLGWSPDEYKDKDITYKSGTKIKRTEEELETAIDRYVKETYESNFKDDRLEHFGWKGIGPKQFRRRLLQQGLKRGVKVLTNPSFTVGQDKNMCPDLERIAEQFPYAKDVVEYLTYKHRRNCILGGGLEWDEEEEAEKGYLANLRPDGRIGTPADTCGAATSRMKHKGVANVPRPTSLYGDKMRALFGVDVENDFLQMGYDFDSLEAREESHYCWKYDNKQKEYCNSLLLAKPLDVHNKMAAVISKIIGEEFGRQSAKNVKYGCTYGAQEPKVAKIIGKPLVIGKKVFDGFWQTAFPLKKLKDALERYWINVGKRKFILGIDGRKVPTRSAHAILNSLFQSAGVICAKRAMVIHDRMLREEGLIVDFFSEDWRNKDFCQQLIAYHDESQLEVRKSSVEFKVFDTKEEAEEFKNNSNKIWSDIGNAKNDKYFIAYNRAGELATLAVKESGEYYNLNVELTAGYMIGRNWKDCH